MYDGVFAAVCAMHGLRRMISLDKKTLDTFVKGAIAALPAIPYIPYFTKKKSMLGTYVLGGIGVALAGGIAAVMFMSPRTRYRALDVAKSTYGKMSSQISEQISAMKSHLPSDGSMSTSNGLSNGVSNGMSGSGYSTTGL